ncbi:MAG: DUF6288 domain-containing protein [Verrucomicrobia bacterium]|nr:DUF6288 domain-containing protein [Verrucomicrobiota bacterium]
MTALWWLGVLISGTAKAQHFEYKEHHLGPTGLFGVTSPTDIKITKVQPGSPADGKIKVDDVIVAAGGIPFKEDMRPQLAAAIDQAETEKSKGILTLTLKDGTKVDLQLKVLGTYSATAPYHCPKTNAIITQTADSLVKSREFSAHGVPIDLLGLLATGEPKYLEVVKNEIHSAPWAKPDFKLSLADSSAWGWGYTNLLLGEYYMLTRDEYVLPALKTYSVALAEGRDAAGLWGHRVANPETNRGQLHGRLPGYAVMNQSSLPCFVSLLLADKCGIKHPEVQAGIEQTHHFYESFIDKGTLPYGVHNPNSKSFNNNGMSGLVAVAFAIRGNTRGAVFFSRMAAAATNTMETGHTGHYFNQLWTGLGADLAGPEISAAFFKETRWLHTLNRTWNGNFTYDDCVSKAGEFSYRGLSDAGSHLLNYCLGRHKLFITGRDANRSIWLKGRDVGDTIALATMDFKSKSDDELLACFGHPLPKVRGEAVWELRSRPHKLMGSIKKLLQEGTAVQRQSAIGYFGDGCPQEQLALAQDGLVSIMRDPKENMAVRAEAAGALCGLGEAAYPYFDDLLKLVMAAKPDDRLGKIDEQLGASLSALCNDPYAAGLVKNKELFYAVVLKLLDHKRASGRIAGTNLIANIPLEDFHYVADKVQYIIDDKDLTYHSYHNLGPKTGSISILANLNIKGGIEAAFATLDDPNGKAGFKIRMLMDVLPKYGANAKYVLPEIQGVNAGKFQKQWDAMVKQIESATTTRKMITLDEAKHYGQETRKQDIK